MSLLLLLKSKALDMLLNILEKLGVSSEPLLDAVHRLPRSKVDGQDQQEKTKSSESCGKSNDDDLLVVLLFVVARWCIILR